MGFHTEGTVTTGSNCDCQGSAECRTKRPEETIVPTLDALQELVAADRVASYRYVYGQYRVVLW